MASFTIDGRTVLITGAARGIGAETAVRLHGRGAIVALVGLEAERLEELAGRIGDRALWHEADVTDAGALADAAAVTSERFGGIDVAVANAGVHWSGAVAGTPLERLEREIEINLLGVLRTVHAVLPQIIERRGYVLNVASLAAASHAPLMGAYAASKAGVEALTDSLRVELAATGARAGCAYFGVIDTDMVKDAYAHPAIQGVLPLLPAFVRRPAKLSRAVDAIEAGIERRSARVWAPRYVGPALALRGLLQPLTELHARRSPRLAEAIAVADADGEHARRADPVLTSLARRG